MILLLFHGPEIFDSGWAARLIEALQPVGRIRRVLAGAMGRTAVIDAGLQGFEFRAEMPGACLRALGPAVETVVFANMGKSEHSGLTLGSMIVERAAVSVPVLQVECSAPCLVEWRPGCAPEVVQALEALGMPLRKTFERPRTVWEESGRVYRRMTTTEPDDFVLVDGIVVGRAVGREVVLAAENGRLVELQGVVVKEHGLEKLERFGGVDLATVKLVSTPALRRTGHTPAVQPCRGEGIAFIDHAGMHVYELADGVAGAVTVGDDTTAVVADILYRNSVPVIGIVDGDQDTVLEHTSIAAGSVKLTVPADDEFGLRVRREIFAGGERLDADFAAVRQQIIALAGPELLARQDY